MLEPSQLADRAAQVIAESIKRSVADGERCAIALSGGTTPADLFRCLAAQKVPWADVDVLQVDERVAPDTDPARNIDLIQRELFDRIEGERPRLHPMDVTNEDLEAAADRYGELLEGLCGRPPVLDVIHLGLGDDGHTASLVPGDPLLDVRDRWVGVSRPYRGYVRLTLTFPVLESARRVVVFEKGAAKARAVSALMAGNRSIPGGRLRARDLIVFADAEAAGDLSVSR